MSLTDTAIRKAKPGVTPSGTATTKPYKMGDSGCCLVAVAIRNPDGSIETCLLDARIDPFALLELAERHGTTVH